MAKNNTQNKMHLVDSVDGGLVGERDDAEIEIVHTRRQESCLFFGAARGETSLSDHLLERVEVVV